MELPKDIWHENIVEIMDKRTLPPIPAFSTGKSQNQLIHRIHSEQKSGVMADEIKEEFSRKHDTVWHAVDRSGCGMLDPYSTVVRTEKGAWFPSGGLEGEDEI